MDILAEVLDRIRLGGTLLFHFELGDPWSLALPRRPYALFHYLSRGSATLALEQGQELQMTAGDFVVLSRGEPHVFYSDRRAPPFSVIDLDRSSAHMGVLRQGGSAPPYATMICGKFTVARPSRGSVLELLPPVLLLKPSEDGDWLEAILRRMVSESASARPGQGVALSRLTEVLFVEVLRSWVKSLAPGEGGWLGAMADPHIGPALQLIHEQSDRPWTLEELGQRVGLGRSAFAARFTKLVGQSMYRYLIARRMSDAAFLLETSDEGIARVATAVGYETVAAFSKVFVRHHGITPGRYRAARRSLGGRHVEDVLEAELADQSRPQALPTQSSATISGACLTASVDVCFNTRGTGTMVLRSHPEGVNRASGEHGHEGQRLGRRKAMPDAMRKVATLSALRSDRGVRVDIDDKKILLVRDGEAVRAYSAVCPHADGPLEEGAVCEGRIVCPWHKATFRVSDGALAEPPALDGLARYPVQVQGDDVFVSPNEMAEPTRTAPSDERLFVIVGAGAAGATAAAALREFGFGARLVLVGREPGLPYDRTSLSKFVVAGQMPPGEVSLLRPKAFYDEHRIERIQAEVRRMDVARREVRLADGRTLSFDAALIATGAVPKPVDIAGADLPGVRALRSREDASALLADVRKGARAVILGSSFIGLEVASCLREQGVEVSVVSPEAQLFAHQFGARVGQVFRRLHEEHGVVFHLEHQAASIEGGTRAESVVLDDGLRLPADLVVAGVGVRPATEFVVGVERDKEGGLPVDAFLRVAKDVYAAGDIAAFPLPGGKRRRIEHWRVAQQQARVAARNMLGGEAVFEGPPFFWTYHYGQNFEYLGHADAWDEEVVTGDLEGRNFVALLLQGGRVAAVVACGRERATAALSERMRAPLSANQALDIIRAS